MVYSPSMYLVASAVALQIQQATASSLYYEPVTISKSANVMSTNFPGLGSSIEKKGCEFEMKVDPTMPNIANILPFPVQYPELLANCSTSPTKSVFKKISTVILPKKTSFNEAEQDEYRTLESPRATKTTSKAGNEFVKSETNKHDDDDYAPGLVKSEAIRKLRDSIVSSLALDEKNQTKRHLEAIKNTDLAKLEVYIGTEIEMTLADLPTLGIVTESPWSGSFWPTVRDSINFNWRKNQSSPAEKYAKAFGFGVTDFMDQVSMQNGIDLFSSNRKCEKNADCTSLGKGTKCGIRIRTNHTSGHCIKTWFGLCHAWATAAILEKEPNCPVTYNGVTFRPMDIKGLLSYLYDGAGISTIYTGSRYDNGPTDQKDQFGRSTSPSFRDLNAGFFHIALANILGRFNSSFIIDVTAGEEVWNQPVRGFLVVEQIALSLEEAAHIFYGLTEYPWNAAAKSIVFMKTRLAWIGETYEDGGLVASGEVDNYTKGKFYSYLLELDGDGKIIGGEWVYGSIDDHPDFLWFAMSKPAADTVLNNGMSYADVSMLLEKSAACSDIEPTAGSPTESSTSNADSED